MELISNLVFLYHTIVASEELLKLAAENSYGELRDYFLRHLEKERGHAQWLADDLRTIGIDVKRTKIPIEAVEMVGSVYYFILHVDPVALLGYMRVLEGKTISIDELERLEKLYSRELLRTLRYHAEHDPNHSQELESVISTLTPGQLALVEQIECRTRGYLQRGISYVHGPTNACGNVDAARPTTAPTAGGLNA